MNLTIYDLLYPKYIINKPVRLIELFGGIGSQAKALKNLGVKFEHYRYVDFDKYAVASYNVIHNTNFETSDITKITSQDLDVKDTDKYCYIMTYSFPCQDLSLAGNRKGMSKGSDTRSGLLWEVERILNECKELPQILLMENVPDVIGEKNVNDFNKWQMLLENSGYRNYHQLLNAKDYGIPQNRNRCFMVSLLGDYSYTFPKKQKLELTLIDMLEDEVDEKYFLTTETIKRILNWKAQQDPLKDIDKEKIISPTLTARGAGEEHSGMILINEATKKGYAEAKDGDGIYINRPHQKRGVVQKQMIQTITCNNNDLGVIDNMRIRKLTPKECWRLMGFTDEDYELAAKVNSNTQLYKQAGNSIVVNVLEAIFKELIKNK